MRDQVFGDAANPLAASHLKILLKTASKETRAAIRAERGLGGALPPDRKALAEEHVQYAIAIATRESNDDEAVSVALYALTRAASVWLVEVGCPFRKFAGLVIRRALKTHARRESRYVTGCSMELTPAPEPAEPLDIPTHLRPLAGMVADGVSITEAARRLGVPLRRAQHLMRQLKSFLRFSGQTTF